MSNTTLVRGEDWVGFKYDAGEWKPYVCARSGNISVTMGFLETSFTGSGDAKTQEPTVYGFTAQLDGLISINNPGNITPAELLASMIAKEKMLWRFVQTSIGGDVVTKEAYFYISGYTDTGSFDGVATFQVSLEGTGGLTIIFTPPPAPSGSDMRYPEQGDTAPATTGSYTWTALGVGGKYILEVVKDGRGRSDIITSGTPVGNEVKYETVGGDGLFTFPEQFEDGETAPYVVYRNL